jgi:hypothetical protein
MQPGEDDTPYVRRFKLALKLKGFEHPADFAPLVGMTAQGIDKVLRGVRRFGAAKLALVCKALEIRPEWLLHGTDPMRPEDWAWDREQLGPERWYAAPREVRIMIQDIAIRILEHAERSTDPPVAAGAKARGRPRKLISHKQ